MENRHQGLCSKGFGQGKLVHTRIEEMIKRSPILLNEVILNAAGEVVTKSSDAWITKFKNGSIIRTIPPDFKGGGQRAGSEDWTDGYFDEWTKYPSYDIFMRQLFSRVRKPVDRRYDTSTNIFKRHVYLGGTAKYQWDPCYKIVHDWKEKVKTGSLDHEVQNWNFKDIPPDFEHLVNMPLIKEMHDNMMPDHVKQEILGEWTSDSSGYYNYADIEYARSEDCPMLMERFE